MKHIAFQRLHVKDFKVYHDVTVDLTRFGPGVHSIRGVNKVTPRLGSNGAGKSTLWDALCFALFGKTTKKLRASDVVPYGSNKNPTVTLDFSVDGKPYRIIRRAWPHSLTIHLGNTADAFTNAQQHIEQLIGIDMDQFMHTVLLAQGQPLFLDLSPREKLELLSDVLNLTRFETYALDAKRQVSSIAVEDHTLQIVRSTTEGQLHEIEGQLISLRQQSERFEASRRGNISKLEEQRAKAEKLLGAMASKRDGAKIDRDAIYPELQDAHANMVAAQTQHNNGLQLRTKAGRMTVGSMCPSCGQPVTKEARAILAEAAETLIESSDYERLKTKHGQLAAIYHQAANEYERAIEEERRASDELNAVKVTLKINRELVDPTKEQTEKATQRRLYLQDKADTTDKRRDQLEKDRQTIEPWVDGFRGIRLMVLDDVLTTISSLATSYANELGLPCTVAFAIERTTKSGTTVSGINMTVDAVEKLEAWSGGEAQRLRLATSLALSASLLVEAGLSFDLLALDEPSAHLSAEGLDELTTFLASHAEAEGRRIFLTDQRNLSVDSTVTLTRADGNVSLA